MSLSEYSLGVALLNRDAPATVTAGWNLWCRSAISSRASVSSSWSRSSSCGSPGRGPRRGDRDAAIPVMRKAVDELHQAGQLFYGVWGTGVLVETLLERGAEGDLAEAQEAIDRLANLRADQAWAMREIMLLRLRALLARAATRPPSATLEIATAPWRHRWASKDTWSGPRRCHDGGPSATLVLIWQASHYYSKGGR